MKHKDKTKKEFRTRRHNRLRHNVSGTSSRPRLNVFRSNKGMYVQLIDDTKGNTMVSAHTREIKSKEKRTSVSFELGELLAKKALEKKIEEAVFDRGGYKYHGRVESLAEGARKGGLKF